MCTVLPAYRFSNSATPNNPIYFLKTIQRYPKITAMHRRRLQATCISGAAVAGSLAHHQHVLGIGLAHSTPPEVTGGRWILVRNKA